MRQASFGVQQQRHECGHRGHEVMAKRAGQRVAGPVAAALGQRLPAGGQHHRLRVEIAVSGADREAVGLFDVRDAMCHANIDAHGRAFVQQHGNDLTRRAVAEQLAPRIFVPRGGRAGRRGRRTSGRQRRRPQPRHRTSGSDSRQGLAHDPQRQRQPGDRTRHRTADIKFDQQPRPSRHRQACRRLRRYFGRSEIDESEISP